MILVSPSLWERIIRNQWQSVAQGAIWEKTMNLHSKTEDKTLKYENRKKSSEGRKNKLQAIVHHHQAMVSIFLVWSSTKRTISEALTLEVPTSKYPMFKSASG